MHSGSSISKKTCLINNFCARFYASAHTHTHTYNALISEQFPLMGNLVKSFPLTACSMYGCLNLIDWQTLK